MLVLDPKAGYESAQRDRRVLRDLCPFATIEYEGLRFKISTDHGDRPLPGQMYFAARNSGWKLLTCAQVIWWDNSVRPGIEHSGAQPDFVVPKEIAYCYDMHECFPVIAWLDE